MRGGRAAVIGVLCLIIFATSVGWGYAMSEIAGRPLYHLALNERLVVRCEDGVVFPNRMDGSTVLLVCRGPESPLQTPLPPRP